VVCVGLQMPNHAIMALVLRHLQQSHPGCMGCHGFPCQRLARGSDLVPRMCKGSGIKYVVHTLLSGLQRGHAAVIWAVTTMREPLLIQPWAEPTVHTAQYTRLLEMVRSLVLSLSHTHSFLLFISHTRINTQTLSLFLSFSLTLS